MEFERAVPTDGNIWVADRQFWLGPTRAEVGVTFWADVDVIHLSATGVRLSSSTPIPASCCAPAPIRLPTTRPNAFTDYDQPVRHPHTFTAPTRVQRRASATGVIVVCGQKIPLGARAASTRGALRRL